MTYPHAILAGAALIAIAVVAAGAPQLSAQTNAGPVGTYQIAADPRSGGVWQTDTRTGEVRLCQAPAEVGRQPQCLPTGAPWE
jgi:hypothetical protein